ncbi:MAG: redoxin domain-containing protein, partial [Planctomycetes bacterium]|nr:redoxin domain-containing protein [Planctomycetota bacterium]
ILIREGSVNAEDFFVTTLTENAGVYSWNIRVDKDFSGADRQVYLDFVCSDEVSSSNVIFAVNYIKYRCNTGWADAISIRNQTVHQGSFPRDYTGQYEFNTGYKFGNLGRFPLYLTLNPGGGVIFPMMQSTEDVEHSGSMSETSGDYTYSHYFAVAGLDFNTALKIGKYGYFDNEYRSTDSIGLFFSGEPRYLGGLVTQPVMFESTWQVDLDEHFFVEVDYNNVEYLATDPNVIITDNIATFTPRSTADTVYDLVITARSTVDPLKEAVSDPFTLYAATCMTAYDCADDDPNIVNDCVLYQCESFELRSSYQLNNQGVDLRVLNKDLSIDDPFCDPNQVVRLGAVVSNTGTTNIFDVVVNFYLDDTANAPIGSHTFDILSTTYMDLPFFAEQVNLDWQVPGDLSGAHRIWVEVSGTFPLEMEEDMLSNNFATLDFFVNEPNELVSSEFSDCSVPAEGASGEAPIEAHNNEVCYDLNMLIPVSVQVCEDEIVCGPVTGYELSYWATLYWPSWSGYCQEFGVAQEAITAFIRTYETIMTLGMSPSLSDVPGALKAPFGWGDGWLPCHPEPTLFGDIKYAGVTDPGCGGMCPVSAWDCGEGYSFQPRFDSPWYNDYNYVVAGGARKITRCYTENDYINVPYQLCFPSDPFDPNQPFDIPFQPFAGGPGGPNGGYGGSGPSGPGSGPGGGEPVKFSLGSPTGAGGGSLNYKGVILDFYCTFESTGTIISNSTTDTIHCVPGTGPGGEGISGLSEPVNFVTVDYQLVEPQATSVALGGPAPDFTLSTVDGEQVSLSSFRGQPVVVVFGTTQCPHCRSRIPFLNQLHDDGEHKVLFVAVNATESSAQQYIDDNQIEFDVLIDTNARTAHQYRVTRVPEIFIVDAEGNTKYNSPELGQLAWFYLADELKNGTDDTDIDMRPTTLSNWAAYGLYDTMPNPQAIIMDINRDQKVDLFDVQMLSLSWLMEDYSGISASGCTVEPLK